jgi:ABC-type multidrug transport system ATPase subunit
MRQKLLITLALAARASLLILDEPTGSLDARSRDRVLGLVEELPRDTTLLLCSHRLSEIRALVDEVIVLEDGALKSQGPVGRFLDAALLSVLEVSATPAAEAWLVANGFRRGPGGSWRRAVVREEKLDLLARIPEAIGAELRDLVVRDTEALSLDGGVDADA